MIWIIIGYKYSFACIFQTKYDYVILWNQYVLLDEGFENGYH